MSVAILAQGLVAAFTAVTGHLKTPMASSSGVAAVVAEHTSLLINPLSCNHVLAETEKRKGEAYIMMASKTQRCCCGHPSTVSQDFLDDDDDDDDGDGDANEQHARKTNMMMNVMVIVAMRMFVFDP